ncbi:MAG: MBL fold metallo-hydrolase [Bacteroidetes bacterium]|nr:MBL fold metallo-hydrolase [Bacteroidota bacterium]
MLVVKSFTFNLFSENTFIVWDELTKESVIIDPGCSNSSEEEKLTNYISEHKLEVKYSINTHCHIDHILGCKFVKEKFNPVYFVPEKDLFLLQRAEVQASAFGLNIDKLPEPDKFLSENLHLNLGRSIISFLFTPGHTPGEFCIYFEREAFCITGDVLFKNSIGRTDLWGGDYDTLIQSIKTKLFSLPENVTIYPGHGENSKIGLEKNENPFLYELSKN